MKSVIAVVLAVGTIALGGDDGTAATVRTLSERSKQVSELKFQSPQPFVMKLNVKVFETFANPALEGTVAFMDTGTFWREDLRFPDYGYSAISDGTKKWILRSTALEPGLVSDTLRLIHGAPSMRPLENPTVKKKIGGLTKKIRENRPLTCIDGPAKFEACFDDATGARVSDSDEHWRLQYSDFRDFHGKLVPRRLDYFWDDQPLISATVIGLEDVVPDPKLFVAGPEYREEAECHGQFTPPKLVHSEDPAFPAQFRGRLQDTVTVTLKLDLTDEGKVKNAIVVKTTKSDFDSESLKAIQKWKFDPARCDGLPFQHDITVQMNFHP